MQNDTDGLLTRKRRANSVAFTQKISRPFCPADDSDKLKYIPGRLTIEPAVLKAQTGNSLAGYECPHRKGRSRPSTQDGRKRRRYRRRWKIERSIVWLGYFRRLVVRYERQTSIFLAFLYFACALIVLRQL
jgi:transposase